MAHRIHNTVLFFLFFLFLQPRELSSSCTENERRSLLHFKAALTDPGNLLSSWVGKNCCSWEGVGCDKTTGHVVRLDLRNPAGDDSQWSLGGEISPSLLGLKHLTYLDLSWNDLDAVPIPEFMGSFHKLQYLNLSASSLEGLVPHQLGNLSNLRFLDLSWNSLRVDRSYWLSRLTSLQHLDMSFGSFDRSDWLQALNMLPSMLEIRLSQCLFSESIPFSLPHVNFTSLSVLDLSNNYFNSTLPGWLSNLTRLEYLSLGGNYFRVVLFPDAIGRMTLLKELDLSNNLYTDGGVPETIENLCRLRSLHLSWMNITGNLAVFEKILLGCARNSIENLDLGGNQLSGRLPEWLGELKNLKSLSIYENSLFGPIPSSIGRLSSLENLFLYGNKLNGTIPGSFGGLSGLVYLNLLDNRLEGALSETHFANLTRLKYMDISSNPLALKVSSNWIPPFRLETIRMSSCTLGPRFPAWLRTQVNYSWLDLSYTRISDSMPDWFWNLSSKFEHLDLSHNEISGEVPALVEVNHTDLLSIDLSSNRFHGPVPLFPLSEGSLDLSNNSFSGSVPRSIGEVMPKLRYLSLAMNNINGNIPTSICKMEKLKALDLSRNHLTGDLPNCWRNSSELIVLDFSNNNLTGVIPSKICSSPSLMSLHLGYNNLHGDLPVSMKNCQSALTLDLSSNKFTGKIPTWLGDNLSDLKILSLRWNMFNGGIPRQLSNLTSLQILDLSHNSLSGPIPGDFNNFSAMQVLPHDKENFVSAYFYRENMLLVIKNREARYDKLLSLVTTIDLSDNSLSGEIPVELTSLYGLWSLNLSGNHLTGEITYKIGQLQQLESLDLSNNQLSGVIPPSLSNLNFLSHLNLSYNNLTGRIPTGNQLRTLTDPSAYIGNPDLCGFPLPKDCEGGVPTSPEPSDGREDDDDEGDDEMLWFYVSMAPGFVVGFWAVWGVLLFMKAWRYAYFQFVDNMRDKLYVTTILNYRLLKAKMLKRNQDGSQRS